MSEHYFSLLWVLRCLLQTRCELGLIVVGHKNFEKLGQYEKPNEKKVLYVFG